MPPPSFSLLALLSLLLLDSTRAAECPCANASLCQPVQVKYKREVFGFGQGDYLFYDWDVVTTIAWVTDPQVMCKAHAENTRVIGAAPGGMPFSPDAAVRAAWIQAALAFAQNNFLDGITFDFEDPLPAGDPRVGYFTQIVRETTAAFHAQIPGSQVSVCVAWSPDDIDGRAYDYPGLAAASDLLYVMVYDTRSQIFDRCLASANAPLATAQRGLQRYLDLGIAPAKLVLGVPWYGYAYPCLNGTRPDDVYCPIREVPFRGVNCSDAAGSEIELFRIQALLDGGRTLTPRRWDSSVQSPYFNYADKDGNVYQMWYDDPQSLGLKYRLAADLGLLGVGPFTYDDLDNDGSKTGNPKAAAEAKAMWQALHIFSPHKEPVEA